MQTMPIMNRMKNLSERCRGGSIGAGLPDALSMFILN
jgi:hypothetical protein